MEVLLIHRLNGVVPPEMMAASLEIGKKLNFKPEELVPGGKLIAHVFGSCPIYGRLPMGGSESGGVNAPFGTNEYAWLGYRDNSC